MKRKIVLLTLGVIVIVVILLSAALLVQTVENQEKAVRVACVGDSITEGTGYPIDLWTLLGPNYIVGNFGVGGATVSVDSNSSYMSQPAFEVAQRFEPKVVIILLGTNDANCNLSESNSVFINSYVQLIADFQGLASKPKIWIVEPPPIFNNSAGLSSEILNQTVIPEIEQVANQTHVPLININSVLADHPKYFSDGVHPNGDGAAIIAVTVYRAMNPGSPIF
jgi:lysophospholipase L1-like esterase